MRGLPAQQTLTTPTAMDSQPPRPVRLPLPDELLPDAELVARALEGDPWAEEALYRRHAEAVLGLAKRMLASRDEAADVTQDAFFTAFQKLSTLRDASTFKTWLMQIAVRYVHRRFRRQRLLNWVGLEATSKDAPLETLAARDAPLEVRAELAALGRVVAELSPAIRVPWLLRYVEGHELTEVATLCDCSLATAKRRIGEAQSRVARHLDIPEVDR